MAKILVADDNSNIQKMVGLALKDQGIEVVAVGNGEAAVRRISDVMPDLVLADVFMPVRNGYEVCEFVKKDGRLAHIPVILLVGAFDPLDEHEAQRVGADGVLKKPFVPPDPLISMVKATLARAGAEARVPVPVGASSAGSLANSAMASATGSTPELAPIPYVDASEHSVEEVSPRSLPVSFEEGHQHLAFGNLLETPVVEPTQNAKDEEADMSFMATPNSELTDSRSWNSPAETEEEEEEPQNTSSWRRETTEELEQSPAPVSKAQDWRSAEMADFMKAAELPFTVTSPSVEALPILDSTTAVTAPETIQNSPWQEEQESLPVAPAAEPAVEETASSEPSAEPPASINSFPAECFPGLFVDEKAPTPEEIRETTQESQVEREYIAPPSPANVWEDEVRKAARLTLGWDAGPSTSGSEPVAAEEFAAPAPDLVSEYPATDSAAESGEDSSWQAAPARPIEEVPFPGHPAPSSELLEPSQPAATLHEAVHDAPTVPEAGQLAPQAAAPVQDMDALVARVLEKMSPDALQHVTREILKPVVEALIRSELEKKG